MATSDKRYEAAKAILRGTQWSGMRWYNTYTLHRTLKVIYFTPLGRSKRAVEIRAANAAAHAKLSKLADTVGASESMMRSGKIYRFALGAR